jgi:hypothetical protein
MTARERRRILVVNDPHGMRISAELAAEIGLPESLILLQLEFLISIANNERDGRYWTYQTLSDLQERYFKFWSISTLSRAIKRLVELDLLIVGNFNRVGFDRTQWFAINEAGVERLSSIGLATSNLQNAKREADEDPESGMPLQDATSILQDEKWMLQGDTAIPETTSEINQRLIFHIPEFGISSDHFWHALLDAVESRATFPRSEIDTWLKPAQLIGRDGDALVIAAPNAVARDRLDARMLPQLRAVAADRFGAPVALRVVVR